MARNSSVTVTGVGTAVVPIDWRADNFGIGFGCVVTGTVTYKVQHTFDDIYSVASPTWFDHAAFGTALSASEDGNYAYPVRAVRLSVESGTGSVTLTLITGN